MGYPSPNPPPSITDKSAKYYLSDSLKTVVVVSGNIGWYSYYLAALGYFSSFLAKFKFRKYTEIQR